LVEEALSMNLSTFGLVKLGDAPGGILPFLSLLAKVFAVGVNIILLATCRTQEAETSIEFSYFLYERLRKTFFLGKKN